MRAVIASRAIGVVRRRHGTFLAGVTQPPQRAELDVSIPLLVKTADQIYGALGRDRDDVGKDPKKDNRGDSTDLFVVGDGDRLCHDSVTVADQKRSDLLSFSLLVNPPTLEPVRGDVRTG